MTRFPKIRASMIGLGALSAAACSSSEVPQTNAISGAAGALGTQPIVAGATSGVSAGTTAAGARAAAGATASAGVGGAAIAIAGSTAAGASGASIAGAAGTATAGASGAAAGGVPTFTMVYADVILAAGCGTGAYCHASDAGGKLKMLDQDSAYAALVGVKAMGSLTPVASGAAGASSAAGASGAASAGHAGSATAGASSAGTGASGAGAAGASGTVPNCVDTGLFRVKPGDPDNSLLVKKLEGTQPCGTSMPPGSMLMPAQISEVRAWIMAGAMNN